MFIVLGGDAFRGQLREVDSKGENAIFRGKVAVGDASFRCYIKPFPNKIALNDDNLAENRSIVSEALGYVLAKACGLVVPGTAGVIVLRREQIPEAVLEKLSNSMPEGCDQAEFLAWFSEDMRHPSLVVGCPSDGPDFLRQKNLSRIAADLASNKSTPGIVSFDEWTENTDRHLGNLLGNAEGSLVLIDHGRLFRHPSWDPSRLATSPLELRNALKELIDSLVPNWSSRTPIRSARGLAYNTFSVSWKSKAESQARELLAEFLEQDEVTQVLDFLSSRLEPQHYNSAVGLMV